MTRDRVLQNEVVAEMVNQPDWGSGAELFIRQLGDDQRLMNAVLNFYQDSLTSSLDGYSDNNRQMREMFGRAGEVYTKAEDYGNDIGVSAEDIRNRVGAMCRAGAEIMARDDFGDADRVYIDSAFRGFQKSLELAGSVRDSDPVIEEEIAFDLLDKAVVGLSRNPESKILYESTVKFWLMRAVANQEALDITPDISREWTDRFYQKMHEKFYGAEAADKAFGNTSMEVVRLTNALKNMDNIGSLMFGAVGSARVEGEVVKQLELVGKLPGRIVAFDKVTGALSTDLVQIMEMHDVDIAFLSEAADIVGVDVAVFNGSPWNNEQSVLMEMLYAWNMAKSVKVGGTLIYEMGLPVPGKYHYEKEKEFWSKVEGVVPGAQAINPQYLSEGGDPLEPGAFLYFIQQYQEVLKACGLEIVNLEGRDLASLLKEATVMMPGDGGDYADPIKTPFWPSDKERVRATLIMRKVKDVEIPNDEVMATLMKKALDWRERTVEAGQKLGGKPSLN